ncbi:MAG TPA: sulfite exporter TauE/SafE family protein, partial [Bradyrhizobium sp.]|nr:sulfite exporter TauE/SafE family protein [Bradyrhizobium sp.]
WRACVAYSLPGIPAAALGARTLLVLPSRAVDLSIGVFLIAMVPVRHWLARHDLKFSLWHLAVGGAVIGYLTGIVVSTGPLSVPLFLFYGLTRGAFLATEAASSLGLYLSKSVIFQQFGALTPEVALKGLIAGSSLMAGAFIAKRFVLRLEPEVFRLVMDAIMLAAGLSVIANAF